MLKSSPRKIKSDKLSMKFSEKKNSSISNSNIKNKKSEKWKAKTSTNKKENLKKKYKLKFKKKKEKRNISIKRLNVKHKLPGLNCKKSREWLDSTSNKRRNNFKLN